MKQIIIFLKNNNLNLQECFIANFPLLIAILRVRFLVNFPAFILNFHPYIVNFLPFIVNFLTFIVNSLNFLVNFLPFLF